MEWAKKHTDTVILLGALFTGFLWLNGKFNDMEKRLVRIETVLIMKGIMPENLALNKMEK
jgi:hypothetical protein